MNILGLSITRTKAAPQTLSGVDGTRGWWPLLRESFTGAWQSNVEVELANVLTYAPVYACLRLISSDIGKLRLKLVRQDDGIWTETESPSFSPVIRKPNHYQTRIKFFQYWVLSKLIHGNTYVLKQRDDRSVVTAMYVLDPNRVTVLVAPDGSVYYQLTIDHLSGLERDILVPAREIIHDVHAQCYHPLVGISPISACGVAAVEGLRIQDSSAVFFGNGSKPGGVLTAPGHIPQETADRLKAYWDANFTGSNAGKVAVLGDSLTYQQMSINARDSQLIEQLRLSAEIVCQAFGVPLHKINAGPPPNYNNIEALNLDYYAQCLQELIENIEELLDFGLGLAPDKVNGVRLGVEFERDDLLQMDTAGRVTAAASAVTSGMSVNEVRDRYFDLGPVNGGALPFLQEQNWPIAHLANRPIPDRAPTPPNDGPPEPDEELDEEPETDMRELSAMLLKEIAELQAA